MSSQQVAFLGLGALGIHMARNLQDHLAKTKQAPLLVWNRTRSKSEALQQARPEIKIADSIEQVASKADLVIVSMLNDAAVTEVVTKLLDGGLKKDAIIVETSTIAPRVGQVLADKASAQGVYYIACPVMGPPPMAEAAKLTLLISGAPEARAKALEYLYNVVGQKKIEVGDSPMAGYKLKLNGNFFVTGFCEVLAEGLTLGEASGVGQEHVVELIDLVWPGTLLSVYAKRMLGNTYNDDIFFPLTSTRKDVNHIRDMAKDANAHLPTTERFLSNLEHVLENKGDVDISGVVVALRQQAGLDGDLNKK
ncbi:hypothetical protein BCR43DRAFT_485641 [Syncephalastrum racemosum]|uniref:6-phosphogluconate dehydrogenase NADP-binding domain-containing protein n=1 Tax=Syncephalastrum racemosum TaxID=13706 RepID=A0A1X2HMY8_SYNRA|nr:hypothetical protein BCR43DRAFT_485641 [Syncephalastrum racemosum]